VVVNNFSWFRLNFLPIILVVVITMENNKENNAVPTLKAGSGKSSGLALKVGTNITLGKTIKKRRKELGITQVKLAKMVGVSETTIQNWEAGTWPKGDYAIALAKALDCSLDWLLMDKGPEPGPPSMEKQIDKPEPLYNKVEAQGVGVSEVEYDGRVDDFGKAVAGLREIFDSRDPVLIPAIQANIHAFQISVRRERHIQQQSEEITALKKENTNIKARLEALEKRLPGPPKDENTEKKVM
jgi:transcriptional regulator with XRE-family HTH domain